ncbi:MAG: hypothetical protein AAFS04_12515 [Cyanobacteria bacterium J06631_9]
MLGELHNDIDNPISQVNADGVYDCSYCYIEDRGAVAETHPRTTSELRLR